MKLCFVGFGNMAQAIAAYWVKDTTLECSASAPSFSVGMIEAGIKTYHDNLVAIAECDVVVLAVKPQQAKEVLAQIGPALPDGCVLISIVTGLTLASLAQFCRKDQSIIRSMPNLPISVGQGATPLIGNQYVRSQQKALTQQLFESAGIVTWLNKESDMDLMTALSGSGPAYVYYFLEAMIAAGKQLGLTESVVKPFVLQTALGAIALASQKQEEFSQLRKKVTSPGGTTAAAIAIFEAQGLEKMVCDAIQAAVTRAKVLG